MDITMPTILTFPPCFSYSSEYSAYIMLKGTSSNPSKMDGILFVFRKSP